MGPYHTQAAAPAEESCENYSSRFFFTLWKSGTAQAQLINSPQNSVHRLSSLFFSEPGFTLSFLVNQIVFKLIFKCLKLFRLTFCLAILNIMLYCK